MIFINSDKNTNSSEIQFSGSSKQLADFGSYIQEINELMVLELQEGPDEFYPFPIIRLKLVLVRCDDDLLSVKLDEDNVLILTGNNKAFEKIGKSLVNFFDNNSSLGHHFHLDYYEGNPNLAKTDHGLIFICDR